MQAAGIELVINNGDEVSFNGDIAINEIDSVQDSEEEHKSSGTFYSDPSSIPSEHSSGMDCNEFLRRYCLKIVTITWNRDSHGLFDFETRQLAREHFQIVKNCSFIRKEKNCSSIDPAIDIQSKYENKAQLLMSVLSTRNKYSL